MSTKETYYIKSFEEDFNLKTLKGKKKVNFQSLSNIIKTGIIKPNTKSFGREQRLSTTILHKNYLKTYRPQGLIFQSKAKPHHVLPFDLVLLSDAPKIEVHYYRIKENLHFYYNHTLIPGFEKFIFKNFDSMIKKFSTLKNVWVAVNSFRKKTGHKILPISKHKLIEYNEAVFYKPIKIRPVAIFGYKKEARELAKKYNLPYFRSTKEFFNKKP